MDKQTDSAKAKRINKWKADLKTGDSKAIVAALNEIEDDGGSALVPILVELNRATRSDLVRSKTQKILFSLKESAALDFLFDILDKAKDDSLKTFVIQCIWQSGFDVSERIEYFTELCVSSGFETAFECVTVIENLCEEPQEEDITASIRLVDVALDKPLNDHAALHGSLKQVLLAKLLG